MTESDKKKSSHKKDILFFFYTYFSITLMVVYVNVYLPVYFSNVLIIDATELAFVQIFAYSAYFIKPLVSIYFDEKPVQKRLIYVILSSCLIASFIGFLFGAGSLGVFGILLGINFAVASILDILIDKQLLLKSEDMNLDESLREKRKNIYIGATQMGGMLATIILSIGYFVMFSDIQSLPTWNSFFLLGILLSAPLLFIHILNKPDIPVLDSKPIKKDDLEELNHRNIILLCIFSFFWGASNLAQYTVEPWIVETYGENSFSLYSLIMTLIVLIYAISVLIAIVVKITKQKRLMVVGMATSGVLYAIAPYSGFWGLILCMAIVQVIAGFLLINYIAILISESKKRVAIFQLVAVFAILSKVVLIPLGTYLYGIGISGADILATVGILFIISAIPFYFIKIKE